MRYTHNKEKIIERMIQYLERLPGGTVITIRQLYQELFSDDEKVQQEIMLSYALLYDLEKAAKKNGLYLDMSKHGGLEERMPGNLDFTIYKKKPGKKCPYCGYRETAKIIYGYPMFNKELKQDLEHHRIKLGGCCISSMDPEYFCFICNKEFGTPASFFSGDEIKHYEDAVLEIQFEIGGFFQGWKTVIVKKENEQYILTISSDFEEKSGLLSEKDWSWLVKRLYGTLFIHEWEDAYDNSDILDGEQWSLRIKFTEGRDKETYGINEYPPYWNELVRTFKKLEKKIEFNENRV